METTVSTRPVVQSLGDGRAAKGLTVTRWPAKDAKGTDATLV